MQGIVLGRLAPAVVGVLLVVSCSSDDGDETTATEEPTTTVDDATTEPGAAEGEGEEGEEHGGHGAAHWNYDEADHENGPGNWPGACSTGARQSPIDVTGAEEASDADLPDIAFAYAGADGTTTATGDLFDSGHGIRVDLPAGRTITIRDLATGEDKDYELKQFHFHTRSEHEVDGEDAPAEVHFVHQAADESLAVVGVLIEEGAANAAYAAVADAAGSLPGDGHATGESVESTTTTAPDTTHAEVTIDLDALLPTDRTYFRYSGSLTTPTGPDGDCAEEVAWHVMTERIELSADQVAVFAERYEPHGNARPVTREGADDLEDSRG